ncbi:L-alanine exporter AlaE [Endozoicomonas sp. GU-1]|uniref:L-alanine exporter AlaE n=1 Tax=Endozoicomonas sp. GU-1 TaxID=3009078 RepID=UPI003FA4050E
MLLAVYSLFAELLCFGNSKVEYIGVLIILGMGLGEIITASISQTVALVILGAPYGQWLGFVRKKLITESVQDIPQF